MITDFNKDLFFCHKHRIFFYLSINVEELENRITTQPRCYWTMSGRGKGHENSGVQNQPWCLKAPQGNSSASYTWGQRRKKWDKAAAKAQYGPLQADCNTACPIFLCSTDVQVLVCREAKPRPNRTNYVYSRTEGQNECRQRLWQRFRCKH